MDSELYDPRDDWRGCISAHLVPLDEITNADMTGVMVGVAAVVINLCLRIQMIFFDELVDTQVISAITQAFCILVPTLLSIGRQELSIFDANYALIVTSSPFMIRVVFSSVRDIFGFKTGLFKRIESHRRTIHFSIALFLILWFGLRLTLRLSSKAFRDSELCGNPTFKDVLVDLLLLFVPIPGPTGGFWLFGLLGLGSSLIVIGWYWVVGSLLARRGGATGLWEKLSNFSVAARDIWDVDSENHEIAQIFFIIADCYWAANLVYGAYKASGEGYKVSFGQLLALFVALPPVLSTIGFVYGVLRTVKPFRFFIVIIISACIIAYFCFLSIILAEMAVGITTL